MWSIALVIVGVLLVVLQEVAMHYNRQAAYLRAVKHAWDRGYLTIAELQDMVESNPYEKWSMWE